MLKLILYIFFMLLLLPRSVMATVKVDISNNMDGSHNSVNVNSNTSSNQQNSNTVNNQTDIKINNNGEVKEYHGSDGNINIQSDDGKSSVKVNTKNTTNNTTHTSSTVNAKTNITVNSNTDSSDASASATPEATVAGVATENPKSTELKQSFWDFFKKELGDFFGFFKH